MLANLAMIRFDEIVTAIAADRGLIYSRYADDLSFSTDDDTFDRNDARTLVSLVKAELQNHGLDRIMRRPRFARQGPGGLCSVYWSTAMNRICRNLTAKIWINICTLCPLKASVRLRMPPIRILRPFMD